MDFPMSVWKQDEQSITVPTVTLDSYFARQDYHVDVVSSTFRVEKLKPFRVCPAFSVKTIISL